MTSMSVQVPAEGGYRAGTERAYFPWGLWGVVCVGVVYGVVHVALRLSLSHNLSLDAASANILAQTLALGYQERQPPLYEWLLWSVQQGTGPNVVSFLLIKYVLLTATFVFLYLSARRLFDDVRWATVAGLSPLLLYQIGWNTHEGVTHTMVMCCAVAASFWAFMRLVENGRLGDYLLFGVAAGLGLISKYGFVAYLIILFVSASLQPALRARVLAWPMLASVAVVGLIAAPFAYWLVAEPHDLVAVFDHTVAPMADNRLRATLVGIANAIYAPLGFLFPLDVILPVMFPGMLREGWSAVKRAVRPREFERAWPDWPLLLLHMTIGGFLFLILGAVFTGASNYLERYMHPFFLLTPLWLFWLAAQNAPARRPVVIAGVMLAVTIAVVPIRAVNLMDSMRADCRNCRLGVPYEGLAAALKAAGFESGTLITNDRNDAGNLRRVFPRARIVSLNRPRYTPPARPQDLTSPMVVVWRPSRGDALPRSATQAVSNMGGTLTGAPQRVRVPWTPFGGAPGSRDWVWMIAVAKPSASGQD